MREHILERDHVSTLYRCVRGSGPALGDSRMLACESNLASRRDALVSVVPNAEDGQCPERRPVGLTADKISLKELEGGAMKVAGAEPAVEEGGVDALGKRAPEP